MIAAEVSKQKAWEKELQEKQEEADKLAKMNDQEKMIMKSRSYLKNQRAGKCAKLS